MPDPTPPPYVCVPERWLTSDQIAASPSTHSAVENELLKKAIELLHANGDRMTAQLLESALLPK